MGEAARVDSLLVRFRRAITEMHEEEAVVGLELWHALFDPLQPHLEILLPSRLHSFIHGKSRHRGR